MGSALYDVAGFKAGKSRLKPVEREELTDVQGKSLLHIQCHFGLDTLSWAREGAIVTASTSRNQRWKPRVPSPMNAGSGLGSFIRTCTR